ncbi:MAG: copper resistance protein NlpE N-terminal domain-containing protein [Bacteroidales bacterium]|jgi:heat shock protein HslJ|nr:copper resistance protein NlpE N-terminal domain-containing protein [Bacteroidales bacterium]
MKTLKLTLLSVVVMLIASCGNNSTHSVKNTVEWTGTYTNILPCADCSGIQTTIELDNNNMYAMTIKYLGKESDTYTYKGSFIWNKKGNQIELNFDEKPSFPNKYIVKENKLIQLDMNGKEITDSNLDYSLEKVSNLLNKKWMLKELNGRKIEIDNEFLKQPYFIINSQYNINGVGICNSFFGSTDIRSGNKIFFSRVASTLMACIDMMDVETEFFNMFSNAVRYSIDNEVLTLYSGNNSNLAEFILIKE